MIVFFEGVDRIESMLTIVGGKIVYPAGPCSKLVEVR
jgi:hypothetical protein